MGLPEMGRGRAVNIATAAIRQKGKSMRNSWCQEEGEVGERKGSSIPQAVEALLDEGIFHYTPCQPT